MKKRERKAKKENKQDDKKLKLSDKKNNQNLVSVLIRYLILLLLMFSLPLIYLILTPLTSYPVSILLKPFFHTTLSSAIVDGEKMTILAMNSKIFIQIIPACIAGSAYLLLLILNLTIPMNLKKRIYSILFSFGIFLLLNIIRILVFSVLYYNNFSFFDFTHKFFWYFLSTVFVVFVWFLTIKIFSIKHIPVYSDFKELSMK